MWRAAVVAWAFLGLIGGGMRAGAQPWNTISGPQLTTIVVSGVIFGPFFLGLKIGQAVQHK